MTVTITIWKGETVSGKPVAAIKGDNQILWCYARSYTLPDFIISRKGNVMVEEVRGGPVSLRQVYPHNTTTDEDC